SLVKVLEEKGIGRPSTYAPTIATIIERGYVQRVDRRLVPTELGFTVNDLLVQFFPDIVDAGFTAQMEEQLDDVASGERQMAPVLREFYGPFHQQVEHAAAAMPKVKIEDTPAGEDCDKCGRPLVIKSGRFGRFIACSGFPQCRNAKPLLEKVGVACPQCREGQIVVRKSKRGRVFYGCERYPACDFTTWDRPTPEPCPTCGWLQVQTAKGVACLRCNAADFARATPATTTTTAARSRRAATADASSTTARARARKTTSNANNGDSDAVNLAGASASKAARKTKGTVAADATTRLASSRAKPVSAEREPVGVAGSA
ncbi:MAG: DNA topoisomerase, partial [Dehalococcoidia bacterium]|nr:DNA topoisomerase [Dehalococcoidia bacterium]